MEEYLKEFRQSGIQLDMPGQDRLKGINAELSKLGTEFGQRVKEGMKSAAVLLDSAEELAGLPADDIASAAEAARTAGHDGKFLLTLIQPSNQPAMAALENRNVRRRLFEASTGGAATAAAWTSWTWSPQWLGFALKRPASLVSRTTPNSWWTARQPPISRPSSPC